MLPRVVNAVLGVWLFVSIFIWPHTAAQFLAAGICGLLIVGIALSGGTFPQARWFNAVVAAALFAFTMSRGTATDRTRLHDALIAVAVFLISLVPNFQRDRRAHA